MIYIYIYIYIYLYAYIFVVSSVRFLNGFPPQVEFFFQEIRISVFHITPKDLEHQMCVFFTKTNCYDVLILRNHLRS